MMTPKKLTQTGKVLRHLRDYGSITPMDAMSDYGIMRLGARIYDLKRHGHVIQSELVQGQNRYGETTRYAKYTLVKEASI